MTRRAEDYSRDLVEVSLSVLVEVYRVLGSYRDALVLIGGWAPYFILQVYGDPDGDFQHVGSVDIDLAVDTNLVDAMAYASMARLLLDRGYEPSEKSLFTWHRTVEDSITRKSVTIDVDFLCPRPPKGKGRTHRHRELQPDLRARTVEGCEIAFRQFFPCAVTGRLPGDGVTEIEIKVANVIACLALKGLALAGRYDEKDAYDVYAICGYHQGGPSAVASVLTPHMSDPTLRAGLGAIREKFRAPDAEGPFWVANFLAPGDSVRGDVHRRDAYETVAEVFRFLEIL